MGRYIFAELAVILGLLLGMGYGSQRAASAIVHRLDDVAERRRTEAMALLPRSDISDPPEPAIAVEPAGTFLGMDDELLLDRAQRQPIVRMKLNRGGSSLSFRVDLADGSRAAFKPAQTNLQTIPRKEVAAYRLNRLLGLNAVPPAATRQVSRDELLRSLHPETLPALPRIQAETIFDPLGRTAGVVMYWVPEIVDSGLDTPEERRQWSQWLTQGELIPVDKRPLAAQLSDMVVFDFLTSNPDRYSGGNMKMSSDGSRLYYMDNTMAFFLDADGNGNTRPALLRTQRFSRRLYDALDRVTLPALERLLAHEPEAAAQPILTASEMRAVVARRDAAKRHIEGLVAAYGPQKVLLFP